MFICGLLSGTRMWVNTTSSSVPTSIPHHHSGDLSSGNHTETIKLGDSCLDA